jgi:VWFA-related protein
MLAQQPAQQAAPAAAPKAPQQATPGTGQGGEPFKFSALSQLVVEIVTVKDKAGKVIEGLTAQDFTVTENGKPQTVSFLEFQKLDDAVLPEIPETTAPAKDAAAPAAEPVAKVTANQISPETPGKLKYANRRLLALYFDMSNMPPADQLRALTGAQKFISKNMTGPDMMAIMEFDNGAVKTLTDFTDDRAVLSKALLKLELGADQDIAGLNGDDSDADYGSAFGQDDSEFNIFTTDRQLSALQTAANMLGHLNEKKSLIYFASGLRLSGVDNQAQMAATANAAIRSNVVIYSADARGLVATPPMGDATQGSPGGQAMYTGSSTSAFTNNFQRTQDTLYALATDTGGKALLDNNDLSLGIVNAQKAVSSYYILGYYTTDTSLDGKFRKINITMKDSSAKLEYRVGYFAGKVFAKYNSTDKERQLEDALLLGDPITDLTIDMEVNYFQLNRAEYFVPVAAKIPGSELVLARRGGAEHTVIDFITEVKDEFGMTIQNVRDKVDIKLSDTTAEKLAKSPIQYQTGFTLLPCTCSMKFLARDEETGRIGTYMNKFVIPNLNKVGATPEDHRIAISSVVLAGQRQETRSAVYNAKSKVPQASPLIQDGQELVPSVTKVFSKSRDMYVYLQAYEQFAEKTEPLVAFVSFYRGQTKAFETPPLPVSEGTEKGLKTVPLQFSLSLAKLPPGRYNCQVTVLDPAGQKAAFWQSAVVLVP